MTRTERAAQKSRMDAVYAETAKVVASGRCPKCGAALRRNNSLAGWWQCSQYGAEGFRADSAKPACEWQGFTR